MPDEKPVLTETEVRQGNSRMLNFRALIFGLILIVIAFAAIMWFMSATYDETATTVDGGTRLEDVQQAPAPEEGDLDETPLPTMPEETLVPEAPAGN